MPPEKERRAQVHASVNVRGEEKEHTKQVGISCHKSGSCGLGAGCSLPLARSKFSRAAMLLSIRTPAAFYHDPYSTMINHLL